MIMEIAVITLVILVAAWYISKRLRASWQRKENACSNCDGTTCKQTGKQDCQGGCKDQDL